MITTKEVVIVGRSSTKTSGRNSLGKGFSKGREQLPRLEREVLRSQIQTLNLEARFSMILVDALRT
jgi:hypothetical protein